MTDNDPPLCGAAFVLIGQNSRGQWVAQEARGLFGGLFANRRDALCYALFETGHHPESILESAGPVELDMSAPALAPERRVA